MGSGRAARAPGRPGARTGSRTARMSRPGSWSANEAYSARFSGLPGASGFAPVSSSLCFSRTDCASWRNSSSVHAGPREISGALAPRRVFPSSSKGGSSSSRRSFSSLLVTRTGSSSQAIEQVGKVLSAGILPQDPRSSYLRAQPGSRGSSHRVTEATALMHVVDSLDELRLPRNLRELHLTRHRISRIDLPADTLASLQKARHAFCASRARATGNHARTRHSSTCGRTASRE